MRLLLRTSAEPSAPKRGVRGGISRTPSVLARASRIDSFVTLSRADKLKRDRRAVNANLGHRPRGEDPARIVRQQRRKTDRQDAVLNVLW